jgi:hypothetical protein
MACKSKRRRNSRSFTGRLRMQVTFYGYPRVFTDGKHSKKAGQAPFSNVIPNDTYHRDNPNQYHRCTLDACDCWIGSLIRIDSQLAGERASKILETLIIRRHLTTELEINRETMVCGDNVHDMEWETKLLHFRQDEVQELKDLQAERSEQRKRDSFRKPRKRLKRPLWVTHTE